MNHWGVCVHTKDWLASKPLNTTHNLPTHLLEEQSDRGSSFRGRKRKQGECIYCDFQMKKKRSSFIRARRGAWERGYARVEHCNHVVYLQRVCGTVQDLILYSLVPRLPPSLEHNYCMTAEPGTCTPPPPFFVRVRLQRSCNTRAQGSGEPGNEATHTMYLHTPH